MVVETLFITSIFRVLASLAVLRWAFVGALIALAADASDKVLINILDRGAMSSYQQWDKYIDQVYMLAFLAVAIRWGGVLRYVALGLFGYRIIGVVIFEATQQREVLLIFPNVFEFWFIATAAILHWRPNFEFEPRHAALVVIAATPFKLFHEWFLHWHRWLDQYNAIEFVEGAWRIATWPFRALFGWTDPASLAAALNVFPS